MTDVPPFFLIPLYIAAVLVFCAFWFVAVPVGVLTYAAAWLADSMRLLWRQFRRFDALLSRKLDQIWAGIV